MNKGIFIIQILMFKDAYTMDCEDTKCAGRKRELGGRRLTKTS